MNAKVILASFFVISFLYSCKKKTLEQKIEKIPPAQTPTLTIPPSKAIVDIDHHSFTLSCGAGCAAIYTSGNIAQDKASVKVTFKVENYINDKLIETTEENYLFYYSNNGQTDKIINDETHINILEQYAPEAQKSFKEFAASMIKDKKIDPSKFKK
jgi:hypothetical protein